MYVALIVMTALVCLGALAVGTLLYRDTLHPLNTLALMLGALYVGYPAHLLYTDQFTLFLSDDDLLFIQTVCLLGCLALLVGVWVGSGRVAREEPTVPMPDPRRLEKIRIAAVACGMLGIAGYIYGIINVGGFGAAYGRMYGGFWSDSGYVRELLLLCVPAVLYLALSYWPRLPTPAVWGWLFVMSLPLLVHGLFGARRGPSFMALASLGMGYYLMRRTRPKFLTLLLLGALTGGFLLFLVSNRGEIHVGSDLKLESSPLEYIQAGTGNEYIYGGANILHAVSDDSYFWGRRHLMLLLIRPIPRALWPDKYRDGTAALGLGEDWEDGNAGLPTSALRWEFGWGGARGATPGIVADFWVDFWWFSLLGLFLVGWFFGWSWRKSRAGHLFWQVNFGVISALSIYLVMQSFEAMSFRYLLMTAAGVAIWKLSRPEGEQREPKRLDSLGRSVRRIGFE